LAGALDPAGPSVCLRRRIQDPEGVLELHDGDTLLVRHDRIPLRTRTAGSVALTMCVPSLPELDGLFAELRRVLRPTGTVAALVPARPNRTIGEIRAWWPLHRALGGRPTFRHEAARDHLHWLITSADFAVLADERRTFRLPVPDAGSARAVADGLVRDGVWPPDVAGELLGRAREALVRYAGRGATLPIPLRLLVARR